MGSVGAFLGSRCAADRLVPGVAVSIGTPWMLVTGCVIVGWIAPEILAAILKRPIPVMLNVLGAIAGGLIAGAFVG